MLLPNFEDATVDIRKLTEYALDPESPRGRHKARVFRSALGYTMDNAEELRSAILGCLPISEAILGETDFYGERYTVDCRIKTETGEATVRTGWIIRQRESFPRLTTCFVKDKEKK
jgi:hypothetical protein